MLQLSPVADFKDKNDDRIARWGRARDDGYRKFRHNFMQPAPMFFTQDHHPLQICDTYRGRSAFLICGGPSFGKLDHAKLRQPGVLTMGLNNSVKTFRPNMHCSVDSPDHWVRSVWLDPTIQKFVPIDHAKKQVFNSDKWEFMNLRVGDCPNVVYYKRNEKFNAKQFLYEDCFNWGCHSKHGGGRSVMLVAVRVMFLLGIRRLYLLGADFNMSKESKYHFDQDRHKGSIKGNNSTYEKLNRWFAELRPLFEANGYDVFNCNPESKLLAFKSISFDDAVEETLSHFDYCDVENERTRGLYETKTDDKKKGVGK
jgi:hypothetical protein